MIYLKTANGDVYANTSGKKENPEDKVMRQEQVGTYFKDKIEKEKVSKQRESKIIESLGAKDKFDAIVKQLNLINESIATGDNTKIKEVDSMVKSILNS